MGITNGYSDGKISTFKPTNTITRVEMVVMINRATGKTYAIDTAVYKNKFSDVPNDFWALQDIIKATVVHTK